MHWGRPQPGAHFDSKGATFDCGINFPFPGGRPQPGAHFNSKSATFHCRVVFLCIGGDLSLVHLLIEKAEFIKKSRNLAFLTPGYDCWPN